MKFKVGDEVALSEEGINQFSRNQWSRYPVPYSLYVEGSGFIDEVRIPSRGVTEYYISTSAGRVYFQENQLMLLNTKELKTDAVNSPKHYSVFDGTEAIEIIASSLTQEEFRGYCFGNLLKYRLRCGKKDDVTQELNKADKYKELYEDYKHLCKDV